MKNLNKKQIAALLLAISLTFHGLACVVTGDMKGAFADFAGAFGTAGLPAVWGHGLTITTNDDETP
jgi:hypothetical protein